MQKPRILISGGAGFIGAHLVARCVADDMDVHVIVRADGAMERLAGLRDSLTVHRLDLGDGQALGECLALARPERIVHLATRTGLDQRRAMAGAIASRKSGPDEDLDILESMLTLAGELPVPPRLFIRSGSIAEYGWAARSFREDESSPIRSAYGEAMRACTQFAQARQAGLPFPIVTARLGLTYGPDQSEDFLIPAMIRACCERRPFTISHPDDRRDLIHIDDVVDGLCRLLETPVAGGTVLNLSTGRAPAMRDVAALIVAATGANPALVRHGKGDRLSTEIRACPDLARSLLDWRALVPLESGIERTVAHMRAKLLLSA